MNTEKKSAFEQSQEIQSHCTTAHQNLLGTSNQISNSKYSQIPVEYISKQFLDLIPKIELLCKTFRAEVAAGKLTEEN